MIVAIDGPAGSGKSTTAKLAASALGFTYIDSGATYRAVALAVIRNNIDPMLKNEVEKLSGEVAVGIKGKKIFLDGEDITLEIRTEEIGRIASLCATYKGVRENMVKLQRKLADGRSVICEGRDIGTVVFPDAEIKIYLDADVETRAKRRHKELLGKGVNEKLEDVIKQVEARDAQDSSREHSPLKIPEDAIIIDTTNLSIDEEVKEVIEIVDSRQLTTNY